MNDKINELELEIKKLEYERNTSMSSIDIDRKILYLKTLLYHELTSPKAPDLSDGVIDLYKGDKKSEDSYTIYLNNTDICIGFIEYRGHGISTIGDIGYRISPEYRGNHYALRALNLIRNVILQRGTDEVIICTKLDNVASIRTIQKFVGKLINKKDDILYFKCNLKIQENIRKR